jgi:hypothetical protein
MFKRLRRPEPFGKAGLTVAVFALVLAMVGGAYAAGGLTKSQEKQVTKIAKKYAGKPGATGPAGPAGTNGTNGKDGANGTNGIPGANGKSVVTGTATTGECSGSNPTGGITVEVEGSGVKKKVCNGKEGSPWTAGGTLPSEATETGLFFANNHDAGFLFEPISFPIPLAAPLTEEHLFYVTGSEVTGGTAPSQCPGTIEAPTALAGNLCVYGGDESTGISVVGFAAAPVTPTGAVLFLNAAEDQAGFGNRLFGTWAVTAE